MVKKIFFTLFLTIGTAPQVLAMEPAQKSRKIDPDQAKRHALLSKLSPNELTQRLWNVARIGAGNYTRRLGELLQFGADVNAQDPWQHRTSLEHAVASGNESICTLLLDNGAHFGKDETNGWTALVQAAAGDSSTLCKTLISYPSFHPIQQKTSRDRIWTALCAMKRYCPQMPRDIRNYILNFYPELQKDQDHCPLGKHKHTPDRILLLPLPVVAALATNNLLDPEWTVACIKKNHLERIAPLVREAYQRMGPCPFKKMFNPEQLEANHGDSIEAAIRERLGLQ